MNILTSRGNLKSKSISNEMLIEKRTAWIVKYWQKEGFPYYRTDEQFRQEKFDAFMKVNDASSLDFNNRIFKFTNAGLALAWSYHPHAFEVECNDNKSPYDVFNDKEIFGNGIRKTLKGSFFKKRSYEDLRNNSEQTKQVIRGILRRVTGSQMVSNYRPVSASALYKLFTDKGDVVYDPSCGWGGRLLASIKSEVNYIGTDPETTTQKGLSEMVSTFGNKAYHYELHTMGSQYFPHEKNSLDFAFTSPPYFDCEKYSKTETTQSYLEYSNIEEWKESFLRKTLEGVYYGLKKNKFLAFNVANVKSYPTFEKDTKQIAKEVGFKLVDTFDLRMSSQQKSHKDEPIFVFKK